MSEAAVLPAGAAIAQTVDVAFGADAAFAPHVATVIASLVRHAPGAQFRFIILHDAIDGATKARVEAAAPGAQFRWIAVKDEDVPDYALRGHFTRAILFRLGLERLAPADCRRVVYLDADIVVMDDVRKLWAFDLKGAPIGAVADALIDPAAFAEDWRLPPPRTGYFNSGVLLIDLEQVRQRKIFSAAMDFFRCNQQRLEYGDQDSLNVVMWNRWREVPPAWNAQENMVLPWKARLLPAHLQFQNILPSIVHFNGPEKPWLEGAKHPWRWLYWSNVMRTPFGKDVAARARVSPLGRLAAWARWHRWRPGGVQQHIYAVKRRSAA